MFVITGGGSGIGRALAKALASRGKSVLIIGRRPQTLLETAQSSPLISFCCADISTDEGRDAVYDMLKDTLELEGLIHNAGTIQPIAPITDIDPIAWQEALAINLNGPLFLSQQLLPRLVGGRVLNIGSAVAHFPISGWAAYCVSKAALAMLTRCFQLECAQTAFASVMPGIIDTDMQALIRQAKGMDPENVDFYRRLHREKRLLSPESVATFLLWLLIDIDKNTYVSQEWDIYDKIHHQHWLFPPYSVPEWE